MIKYNQAYPFLFIVMSQFFTSIISLIASSTAIILGIYIGLQGLKDKIKFSYFLAVMSAGLWLLFYSIWLWQHEETMAILLLRVVMFFAIFTYPTLLHFVFNFLNYKNNIIIYLAYFSAVILALFDLFTNYFMSGVSHKLNYMFWPNRGGFVFDIYVLMWIIVILISLILLFSEYKKTSIPLRKTQLKLVLIGIILGYIGGATNFFLWYDIPIPPFGNILIPVYFSLIAYAILKYRFMDIRFIVKRSIIFSILVFVITASYALLSYVISTLFQDLIGTQSLLFNGTVTAIIIVLTFEPIKKLLSKWTDSFLYKGVYNPQQLMSRLSTAITGTLNLKKTLDIISDNIYNAFHPQFFSVYLYDDKNECFKESTFVGKRKTAPRCLTGEDMLNYQKVLKKYSRIQNVIVSDELKNEYDIKPDKKLKEIIEQLEKSGVSVTLPVFLHNKPVAIYFLGSKKSGDCYSQQDLNLLEIIAAQSATAIENSSLYTEVNDLNKNLQKKVKEQTKDIVEKNKKLERLLMIKSEFLDIASHQLRTPVSVICGILDMFKSGSMDKLPKEKQMEFIGNAFAKGKKLNAVINDILDASDLDEKELDLADSLTEINLSELVNNVIDYINMEAKDKQIKIKTDIQKDVKVEGDNKYLEQAIGNLLDNAIKYTPIEKEIEVSLKKQENKAILKIKDSGIGIPEKEQKNLFQKFTRASNAKEMHTDGSGLGLFIVKKVINAHPGAKIWFESKKGQGTTFFIELKSI